MHGSDGPADDENLILGLARAFRDELGGEIEDQPGGPDPAGAGQANRGFRAAVRYLLDRRDRPGGGQPPHPDRLLARAARLRLADGGLDPSTADRLADRGEGGGRADWFAYLLLTPWPEIEHLLGEHG